MKESFDPMTLVLRRVREHRPCDRGPHDYDVLAGK
jgi:hypothetical protein